MTTFNCNLVPENIPYPQNTNENITQKGDEKMLSQGFAPALKALSLWILGVLFTPLIQDIGIKIKDYLIRKFFTKK